MTDVTVYLAGPVAAVEDGGAGWRDAVQDEYADRFQFEDPLSKYNIPVQGLDVVDGTSNPNTDHTVGVDEIVEGDKEMLRASDGVLVGYSAVQSIGTPMEVMWARERDYPVAIWVRDDTSLDALSPWYRYHATALTTDPELALNHLQRHIGSGSGG